MSYLFIDSTYDLTLGVLDEELNWMSFETEVGQKASAIIQKKAYELIKRHGLRWESLSGVITVNGPGFYTGLRLAEGFSDVFSFFRVKQFSFYSYEIPYWCGFSKGTWFTKAYRGEYFFYEWSLDDSSTALKTLKELPEAITEDQYFIHSIGSLDDVSSNLINNPFKTRDLLQLHPKKIFPHVVKGLQREPFYFRAPEDEFKANP